MPANKNQHYIPQSYMKFFSGDGRNISIYNIKRNNLIVSSPIRNTASQNYFYSKDIEIEKQISDIEKLGIEAFRSFINGSEKQMSSIYHLNALIFTLTQRGRTLSKANELQYEINKFCLDLFNKTHGTYDEHLCFRFDYPAPVSLAMSLTMLPACMDLRCKILNIQDNLPISFITSDNPVCIMNPFFEICGSRNKLTLENKGICIFMPFSPNHAIMFYDSDVYKIGNRKSWNIYINKEDVYLLNRIIINNANEILIFKDLKYFNAEIIRKVSDKNHSLTTDKKGIKFSFMRFLDKANPTHRSFSMWNIDNIYRRWPLTLYRHPELYKEVMNKFGTASTKEKKEFYKSIRAKI